MPRFAISRRTVLRGAGGAVLALPPLEIMGPRAGRAAAAAVPNRFLMAYAGLSPGVVDGKLNQSQIVPRATGAGYELPAALAPIGGGQVGAGATLETYPSVKADMGLVSGLIIPQGPESRPDEVGRPAGRAINQGFHGTILRPQISGESMGGKENNLEGDPAGSTADQLVADSLRGAAAFHSLPFRIQASYYYGVGAQNDSYSISYKNGRSVNPLKSLRQAYSQLFSAGAVNGKTFDVAAFIDRRKSILDVVLDKSNRLLPRLGVEDRARMSQYFTEIRSLESSLERLKMKSGTMTCQLAAEPVDPPIGEPYLSGTTQNELYAKGQAGWSDEETRARVMIDIAHLAFACDLTRTASLYMTLCQSGLNAYHLTRSNVGADLHGVGHNAGTLQDAVEITAWHFKHFSRLVAKLKTTTEVDGSRLLDHCALHMMWDGGHGRGIPSESLDTGATHSTENMIVVVAGGAGGLKSGQHIKFNNDRHPAQVVLTHMKAVVPETERFGELTDPLPELFQTP